ncbi:MAG: hypothetical protein KY446_00015 [Proteobacteria bacterium]|nr:hypothetical protein [Pseudomonadota bacterium]
MTLTAVAARLGVPEYRLRRAINQGLGARNFNAYLNGFRLAEARAALADPTQRTVPILTITLDAGFGAWLRSTARSRKRKAARRASSESEPWSSELDGPAAGA